MNIAWEIIIICTLGTNIDQVLYVPPELCENDWHTYMNVAHETEYAAPVGTHRSNVLGLEPLYHTA